MEFGKIENIIWLVFVLVLIYFAIRIQRWRQKTKAEFADENLLQEIFPHFNQNRQIVKLILISFGLILATIALMDPLFGEEEVKVKREGIDVIYALDLSNSMDVEDVAPSRLEKAKKIITESVDRLGGDRVGLIVFAADAYVISPLTNDYSAIQSYVNGAETNLISQQGTNFSEVLVKAKELFQGAPNTGKLLVVLSDGEDNESSISKAISLAKESNVHIVSIGIGSSTGGPIPVNLGGYEEYKLDQNGQTVISKLVESSMKKLASTNNGKYILGNHTYETLNSLHNYLNSLDKDVQDSTFSKDKKHIFQWFLAIAVLLIFIDTLTTEHKLFKNKKL